MRLVNISEDHYIIVDDLDIEIGDWVYVYCSEIEVEEICQVIEYYNEHFSFETCLDDWVVGNWAWSVEDESKV